MAIALASSQRSLAETYIGADAAGQIINPPPAGLFLWPMPPIFNGATWEVLLPYRIDAAFAGPERLAIINAFDTWNARVPVAVNLFAAAPGHGADLESVMLHEIGHALGLGHPNYERGGLAPAPGFVFTGGLYSRCAQRELNNFGIIDGLFAFFGVPMADCGPGGDGQFGTFDDTPALPFPLFGPDDIRYFDEAFPNNPWNAIPGAFPGRAIPIRERDPARVPLGGGRVRVFKEAVIVQGHYPGDVQRQLIQDDVFGLLSLEAALSVKWGMPVTYRFVLVAGAPVLDCPGPDGWPASLDDTAVPFPGPDGVGLCPPDGPLQSNRGIPFVGPYFFPFDFYSVDVFKGGNPAGSLALTDNVFDVAGVVHGRLRKILGSDIFLDYFALEVILPGDIIGEGVDIPEEGGGFRGEDSVIPERDLQWPTADCDGDGTPDQIEIANGEAQDCNGNEIPDNCEPDCNQNGVADLCDLAEGTSQDLNENYVPDECETPEIFGACCVPIGACILTTAEACDAAEGVFGGPGSVCVDEAPPAPWLVDPFDGPCLLWNLELSTDALDFTAGFDSGQYTISDIVIAPGATSWPLVRLYRPIDAPDNYEAQLALAWAQGSGLDTMGSVLVLIDANGYVIAWVGLLDSSLIDGPTAAAAVLPFPQATGQTFGLDGAATVRFEVEECEPGAWRISALVNGDLLVSGLTSSRATSLEIHVRRSSDPTAPFGSVSLDHLTYGEFPPHPMGDLNGDGVFNGLDIKYFVDCLIGIPGPEVPCMYADFNCDGVIDTEDIPGFVTALVSG